MRNIHPERVRARVTCGSCGASFELSSTVAELRVDVCSRCHPAYTGRVTTAARGTQVERFAKRWGASPRRDLRTTERV
jgi:large subunit ribosomal protein L31